MISATMPAIGISGAQSNVKSRDRYTLLMINVVVLGGSGMLGSMVTDVLAHDQRLHVTGTVRNQTLADKCRVKLPNVEWKILDLDKPDATVLHSIIGSAKWIINAIGITKPYIHDDNPDEVERALRVNAMFPYELARLAAAGNAQVLQIVTDCVYSGARGQYHENDDHDALDAYGKTKSMGEALFPNMHCLRCSIIGPEPKGYVFLLEWFLRQPVKAKISGYINHRWNGVTTLHFARFCRGIIIDQLDPGHLQHMIPGDIVSKAELLQCFAKAYQRTDVMINPGKAKQVVDRTLATRNADSNSRVWQSAGYAKPPTIQQMVQELAQYKFSMKDI